MHHPLEESRIYRLDEIINNLEKGIGIEDLVINRQKNGNPVEDLENCLCKGINSVKIKTIPNRYKLDSEIIKSLK
jgi:hypothetical protein